MRRRGILSSRLRGVTALVIRHSTIRRRLPASVFDRDTVLFTRLDYTLIGIVMFCIGILKIDRSAGKSLLNLSVYTQSGIEVP